MQGNDLDTPTEGTSVSSEQVRDFGGRGEREGPS